MHTAANASLIAGLGYAGILVAFVARQNPWMVIPVAILFGGFGSAGSLLQRRMDIPDASVLVLQGFAFMFILASEALRGRLLAPALSEPVARVSVDSADAADPLTASIATSAAAARDPLRSAQSASASAAAVIAGAGASASASAAARETT